MNSRSFIYQLITFIIYLFVQVLIIKNLVLYDRAFCFVYLAFLLFLPFDLSRIALLMYGLLMGFFVDVFYDSLGIHMAACVLMVYIRPSWLSLITPRGGYELVVSPMIKPLGMEWFTTYAFPLILVHHTMLFYIEAGGFHLFFFTFTKVFLSSILTLLSIIIVQYLFYSSPRSSI